MSLKQKMIVLYMVVSILILGVVGVWLTLRFGRIQQAALEQELLKQLQHIDFILTNFIEGTQNDVGTLAANEIVQTRDDQDFTNFLDADEETFTYNIGEVEQQIIRVFNDFRATHPYVNSVYMGRENGSFVRSHKRARPTQYDPRTRPWYILGKENPGKVMRTEPYPSVTTADINLGIVTALLDEQGTVYGVVGTDITLVNLAEYLSGFEVGHQGQILLVDEYGTILVSRNDAFQFKQADVFLGDSAGALMNSDEGSLTFTNGTDSSRLFFHTSPSLGWKIAVVVPSSQIQREIRDTVLPTLLSLSLALLLVSMLTFIGLNLSVIKPLMELNTITQDITETGNLEKKVEFRSNDEIGSLAKSFDQMIMSIRHAQKALRKQRDLATALKDAAIALTDTLDAEIILDRILEQVSRVIPNEACNVMLIEDEQVRAVRWVGYDHFGSEGYITNTVFSLSETPNFTRMVTDKKPIIIPDTKVAPDWQSLAEVPWLRSYAAAPIIVRNQVIGFLNLDSSIPDFFQRTQLSSLEAFASYAGAAIENARLFEQVIDQSRNLETRVATATREISQRMEELAVLNELSRGLTSHLGIPQILMEAYKGVSRLLDAANFYVTLYDSDRDEIVSALRVVDGNFEELVPTQRGGLSDYLMKTRQPLLLEDNVLERLEPLGLKPNPYLPGRILASWVGVPMVLGDRVLGTMAALSYTTLQTFDEQDKDLLWAIANQTAIAINNAQLYRRVQKHAKELTFLHEIDQEITSTLDVDTLLQTIASKAAKLVESDRSLILLIDDEKKALVKAVGAGYSKECLERHTFEEFQSGISGWVLKEKVPTLSEDLKSDSRNRGIALAQAIDSTAKSAAIAPLLVGDRMIGTLTVINNDEQPDFDQRDLDLVTRLAGLAAMAIRNAQLYKAAQEADHLKSAFLASMSHELRTPLNSIIGFTGILLQGLVGPLNAEQSKQLGMVQNSARHLLALINDVLDISKIEAGQLNIAKESVDICESIQKVVKSVKPLADKKGLPIYVDLDHGIVPIISDQRRVEQILINLINNAIKFTDKGEIRVKSNIENGMIITSVSDTGIGIKLEDQDKIFKTFQQIDTGLSRKHEGTGLGLSISKKLVELLGGTIWVESQWSVGSTFTFTLPFKPVQNGEYS